MKLERVDYLLCSAPAAICQIMDSATRVGAGRTETAAFKVSPTDLSAAGITKGEALMEARDMSIDPHTVILGKEADMMLSVIGIAGVSTVITGRRTMSKGGNRKC